LRDRLSLAKAIAEDLMPPEVGWLDALNTLAERARTAGDGDTREPWTPPENSGPLPPHLLPLAQSILIDQAHAIVALQKEMSELRTRDKVVRSAGYDSGSIPAYVDHVG
jgi:hypothetical protein